MDAERKINKRGQMTLFIIIAIAIVIIFVLIFFARRVEKINTEAEYDAIPFIQSCVRKATYDALDIMMPQGGFVEPESYKTVDNVKVTYLCENTGNYKPCINQHPVFLNDLKDEIREYVTPRIDECFESVREEFTKRNRNVEMGDLKVDIELAPKKVRVKIEREMKVLGEESSRSYSRFDTDVFHPVYDLAMIANEIASQEAKYCYFEYLGYMALYSEFDIEKKTLSDSTKIYSIEDKQSKKKMNIAIRGCAIPPGL